jgi:reactive chlorine resistance protein C
MQLEKLASQAEEKNIPFVIISIGICLVLFWLGIQKITPTEANGISPLIVNSPLIGWTYSIFGKQGATEVIGAFEWLTAIGLIAGNFKPKIGLIAAVMAMLMFFVTTTFLLSTPGTVAVADGIWGPTGTGEFLLKDITLFGAAMYLFTQFGRKAAAK